MTSIEGKDHAICFILYNNESTAPVSLFGEEKRRITTFGMRNGFLEAYSHSLPILRSFGSSSCKKMVYNQTNYFGKCIYIKFSLLVAT